MIKFGTAHGQLGPAPIRAAWVLEGKPVARNKLLSRSADGTASTYVWDCTAGKFNWHYEVDETAYVLEGRVIIKDQIGYVRKVAFLRVPLPWQVLMAKRFYHALKRLMGSRRSKTEEIVPSMS
jgi:uncharacterized cupin superfamily protein